MGQEVLALCLDRGRALYMNCWYSLKPYSINSPEKDTLENAEKHQSYCLTSSLA